mgnify:CR=1 FL=1
MKAPLIYWHKARLKQRYILEMEMYDVGKSERYPDGIKYRVILIDPKTKKKVLMDNHHPKGHHIHLNERQIAYEFLSVAKLIEDFSQLVLEHLEVKL